MNPDEIEVGYCYSMAPISGRRNIARVTKLFNITAMAAYKRGWRDVRLMFAIGGKADMKRTLHNVCK